MSFCHKKDRLINFQLYFAGIKRRSVSCVRKDDNTEVNSKLCTSLHKPPVESSCYNQDCPPE